MEVRRELLDGKVVWTILVVLLAFQTSDVGSLDNEAVICGDGSSRNGQSSLCRVVRNNRNSFVASFQAQYTASNSYCGICNQCANVTCSAEFSRGKVNAGLVLKLCKEDPEVDYWVDIPGQWDEPWVHTFSSKNEGMQRVEIAGSHNGASNQSKPTKWFIKNNFSITHGRIQLNKYISLMSVLQICQTELESSCRNTTILDFPRLPQDQVCYDESDGESGGGSPSSSSRSSRNAYAWDPQDLHRVSYEKAKKFENGRPIPAATGDHCDAQNIFGCGPGMTCVLYPTGPGICQCLPGFIVNGTSGCVKRPSNPSPPAPSTAADSDSRSYSSAIGAIVSILILVTIAAGMFFATKYHYFDRFRHRIPVLRCWPFRRRQPWEYNDNVTMVNPLGPPLPDYDDDPPLL